MNSKDFVLWFGGFVDAVEGIPTQFQWDLLKNKLSEVGEPITWPVGVPNTAPIQTLPFIQPADPYNPYKVYCGDTNGVILTTTSGSGVTYNIPGITTNGNTTWTNIPKGANIIYTSDL
jgi:hypothetical protein